MEIVLSQQRPTREKKCLQQCSRRLMKLTLSYFSLRRLLHNEKHLNYLLINAYVWLKPRLTENWYVSWIGVAEANRPMRLLLLSSELQMVLLILNFYSILICIERVPCEFSTSSLTLLSQTKQNHSDFHVNNIASVSWLIHGKSHKLHMLFIGRLEQLANG